MMRFWVCVWLGLAGLMTGCEPKGTPVDGQTRLPREGAEGEAEAWPGWFPRAVDVRVHPASRYVKEGEALRLEARVELLDQFNEPIKDVGKLAVELRVVGEGGRIVRDAQGRQRGFRWDFDLTTRAKQEAHWDAIARAYVFQLQIDPQDADVTEYRTLLRATFDPSWPGRPTIPTGDREQQAVEIRTDW